MDIEELDAWLPPARRRELVQALVQRIGLTRTRAECFVRLWVYLLVQQRRATQRHLRPPLADLTWPDKPLSCTQSQASELFYSDRDRGSERAAGLMLDKLAALGLIEKHFDGNTTQIAIRPVPELTQPTAAAAPVSLQIDDFDPRCDAIPVANLLAENYNWMNRNADAVPYRIAKLLRGWAQHYGRGMRVLRRADNLNPVGFYLFYPTAPASDANFFGPASKGLHLSALSEVDPFQMAEPGDRSCTSIFIRSWAIARPYLADYRARFLQDGQATLRALREDFPNLCDLHALIIHPGYERLAQSLGFQRTSRDDCPGSVYWMYLALDRFLALDIEAAVASLAA